MGSHALLVVQIYQKRVADSVLGKSKGELHESGDACDWSKVATCNVGRARMEYKSASERQA